MKKILILLLFFIPCSFARDEFPLMPLDRGVDIRYSVNNLDLIDVDKMKRSESVNKAKDELKEKQINPIQIDTRYLKHQRALDYVSNPNNYLMLPVL